MSPDPAAARLEGLDPSDFDALSFDVYGTLLDWEPEIVDFLDAWLAREGETAFRGADLLDAYDRLRQPLQDIRPALPYPEILRRSLSALAGECGVPVRGADLAAFAALAARHRPWPDSAGALARLRQAGFTLAALSNIDEASFASAMAGAGLGFDVVVTAERVGAYKPDPAHFRAALADLAERGIPGPRVLHVAQSLRADIVPARALGLTTVWICRPGHAFGRRGRGAERARPDFTAPGLDALADVLCRGRSA